MPFKINFCFKFCLQIALAISKKNEHFDLWKPKEVNIKESYFATDFTVAIPTINIFLHLKRK
jgi:hypothetical protein